MIRKVKRCRWCGKRFKRGGGQLFCSLHHLEKWENYLGHWHWDWIENGLDTTLWRRIGKPMAHWYIGEIYNNNGAMKRKFLPAEQ